MNQDKAKIVKWIQDHEKDLISFLKKLVQTASDNPAGDCLPIAKVLEKQLSGLGFENITLLETDEESVKANGMISMANVLAPTVFGEGINVVLNAHGDVVPPGLGWSVDPYGGEIIDGKMYGRGVAVSKSDIAAYKQQKLMRITGDNETLANALHNQQVLSSKSFQQEYPRRQEVTPFEIMIFLIPAYFNIWLDSTSVTNDVTKDVVRRLFASGDERIIIHRIKFLKKYPERAATLRLIQDEYNRLKKEALLKIPHKTV